MGSPSPPRTSSSSRNRSGRCSPPGATSATGQRCKRAGCGSIRGAGRWTGGSRGAAVVPGKPAEGYLVDAINYGDVYQMPPDGKLPQKEIDALTRWVRLGAPWPAGETPGAAAGNDEFDLAERARHWSFQSIGPAPPPQVNDESWLASDVDRFILSGLQAAGLKPAAPADRRTLIRRVYFDLVGLPPTPADGQSVRGGRLAAGVPAAGRPVGSLAPLRRTLGAALAGFGPLRRIARARVRLRCAGRTLLPRLRDPGLQRRRAVQPIRHRAPGRRPAR